jgi:hypothetical protein
LKSTTTITSTLITTTSKVLTFNPKTATMQFIATVLALAATSSAAVLPRSEHGSWAAQVTVSPDHSIYVTALFTSDAYPEGLMNACVENPFSNPPVPHRCDHAEFDFSYDGQCKIPSESFLQLDKADMHVNSLEPYPEHPTAYSPDCLWSGIHALHQGHWWQQATR